MQAEMYLLKWRTSKSCAVHVMVRSRFLYVFFFFFYFRLCNYRNNHVSDRWPLHKQTTVIRLPSIVKSTKLLGAKHDMFLEINFNVTEWEQTTKIVLDLMWKNTLRKNNLIITNMYTSADCCSSIYYYSNCWVYYNVILFKIFLKYLQYFIIRWNIIWSCMPILILSSKYSDPCFLKHTRTMYYMVYK